MTQDEKTIIVKSGNLSESKYSGELEICLTGTASITKVSMQIEIPEYQLVNIERIPNSINSTIDVLGVCIHVSDVIQTKK